MTLGGSLETSSVSSFLLNPPRDPKDPKDPQPETRFAAMSTQASRAGNANRVGPPVAARSSLRRNVMLPLKHRPLRRRPPPQKASPVMIAQRPEKNAPIMVFFCPVMGRGSLTIPVFCGIRSWPGSEPRPARQAKRFGLSGLSFLLAPLGGEIRCRETVAELGMANLAVTRGFDPGPGLGIGKQRLEHQRAQAMAAAIGAEGAEDGRAGESKIADRIERLVPHEFVGEAKTFAIDDAVVADGNRIVERSAESKPGSPEPLHVLHEAEGPGAGDFAAEGTRVQVDLDALIADQRGIEIDGDIEMETVMRGELAIGAGIFHRDLLQNFEVAAGGFELGQAHLVDRLDKARGAAVHDRNFGAVDLD